jgi:hypothetical protein
MFLPKLYTFPVRRGYRAQIERYGLADVERMLRFNSCAQAVANFFA